MAIKFTRTSQPLIELRGIGLSFGSHLVLRDVNALVTKTDHEGGRGQILCFLGPSGSGKSQLARMICGLQRPTSGAIILDGDVPTRKGLVGLVPQAYPLFDFMTVWDNLIVAGDQAGLSKSDVALRARGYIQALGIQDYVSLYPRALSGGTCQRVAIARQMMCAGHYLVMDEPFSGLDPIAKAQASHAISQLAEQDSLNTIIVITHDISEGLSIADTAWLLGRETTPDGKFIPGARLVERYDLAEMDLAWHPDIQSDKRFLEFVGTVKARFKTL